MAKIPTKEHSLNLRRKAEKAEQKKKLIQKKQNKTFVNHGQGVMPETVWTSLPGKKEAHRG